MRRRAPALVLTLLMLASMAAPALAGEGPEPRPRACRVETTRAPEGVVVAGWREAWPILTREVLDELPPPATELEARERLCDKATPCPTDRPSMPIVDMTPLQPMPGMVRVGAVLPLPDGRLRVLPGLFEAHQQYHCVPEADVTAPEAALSRRVHHLHLRALSHTVVGLDDEGRPCEPGSDGCMKGCFYDERVEVDLLAPAGKPALLVTRRWSLPEGSVDGEPRKRDGVTTKVEADGVRIRGCGRDLELAF